MFAKKQTNDFDRRAAELARENSEHQALAVERSRLNMTVTAASATRERAHAALSAALNDPMTAAFVAEDEAKACKLALVTAVQAETKATDALASHVEKHGGDLGQRAAELGAKSEELAKDQLRATHGEIVAQKIARGLQLEALEVQEEQLLREAYARWPDDGAGIIGVMFPAGVFTPYDAGIGLASVFRDDLLRRAAVAYPEALPDSDRAAVVAKINKENERGVKYFGMSNAWEVVQLRGMPQRNAPTPITDQPTILRRRTKRRITTGA